MSKHLQAAFIQLLNMLMNGLKSATAFAHHQIPLLIQELLHYHLVMALLGVIVFGSLILIGSAILIIKRKWFWKITLNDSYGNSTQVGIPITLMSWFGLMLFQIPFWLNLATFIQIEIAPRVWLLNYLRSMLAGQ